MKSPIDPPFNNPNECPKYPKILDYGPQHGGLSCVMFEKHDGSNLAWHWRNGVFSHVPHFRSGKTIEAAPQVFWEAPGLFEMYEGWWAPAVAGAVGASGSDGEGEAILFTEFRGPNSFSGEHVAGDVKKLYPIDLWIKGKGFMPPRAFSIAFAAVPVDFCKLTSKVVEDIRKGRLGVNEGVVCKGGDWGSVWCCKIKTDAWLARGGEA